VNINQKQYPEASGFNIYHNRPARLIVVEDVHYSATRPLRPDRLIRICSAGIPFWTQTYSHG